MADANESLRQERASLQRAIEELQDELDHRRAQSLDLAARRGELSTQCARLLDRIAGLQAREQELLRATERLSQQAAFGECPFTEQHRLLLHDLSIRLRVLDDRLAPSLGPSPF